MLKALKNIYLWIFARPVFRKFNMLIFQCGLRGLGVLNYQNDDISGEKYFIKNILPQVIKKDVPVFMDVGANIGNYTLSLAEIYPKAHIHAFEPHPGNFSLLKSKVSSSNVRMYNVAIGESKGELTLYDRADHVNGSAHASLYKDVISEIHKQDTLEFSVAVETLDEVCASEEIIEVDFIKIDTEGNELAVLRGAKKLIGNMQIRCIHFEFNEMNVVSRTFLRDFRSTLQNYDLYRLLPRGIIALDDKPLYTEIFAYQNIIALPKNRKLK